MVSKTDHRFLRTTADIIVFLLYSILQIVKSILMTFVPKSYLPKKSLDGEIVLITGGGGGIGRLVALRIARMKAKVVVWDIADQGVEETIKLVEGVGGKAYGYKCDISNCEDVYRTAKITTEQVGPVTVLINNAGVASGKFLMETPDKTIRTIFDVNAISHFWTTKAFLPDMLKRNHGHIVTVASMAGHVGISKMIDYCASKYAAVGFDEALRIELDVLGANGVKTTCICPYFIQSTGMFTDVRSRYLPRLKANDVADAIVDGIVYEKLIVMLPGFFRHCLFLKWIMPMNVCSLLFRYLVPDAAPSGGTNIGKINNNPETQSVNSKVDKPMKIKQETGIQEKTL